MLFFNWAQDYDEGIWFFFIASIVHYLFICCDSIPKAVYLLALQLKYIGMTSWWKKMHFAYRDDSPVKEQKLNKNI